MISEIVRTQASQQFNRQKKREVIEKALNKSNCSKETKQVFKDVLEKYYC